MEQCCLVFTECFVAFSSGCCVLLQCFNTFFPWAVSAQTCLSLKSKKWSAVKRNIYCPGSCVSHLCVLCSNLFHILFLLRIKHTMKLLVPISVCWGECDCEQNQAGFTRCDQPPGEAGTALRNGFGVLSSCVLGRAWDEGKIVFLELFQGQQLLQALSSNSVVGSLWETLACLSTWTAWGVFCFS